MQKKNLAGLISLMNNLELDKKETWKKLDYDNMTMAEFYKKMGISDTTQDFLGNAVALYTDDDYLERNCKEGGSSSGHYGYHMESHCDFASQSAASTLQHACGCLSVRDLHCRQRLQ